MEEEEGKEEEEEKEKEEQEEEIYFKPVTKYKEHAFTIILVSTVYCYLI